MLDEPAAYQERGGWHTGHTSPGGRAGRADQAVEVDWDSASRREATEIPASRGGTPRAGGMRLASGDRVGDWNRGPRRGELPAEVVDELASAVGRERGERFADQLAVAVRSYQRDRYEETFRITRDLVSRVPESLAAVELHGLACYRMGRWQLAIRHLTTVAERDGVEGAQLPVLMDCHRALGHHHRVAELWEELRSLSPEADVLVEGRLVYAADLADRGQLTDAISVLVEAGAARTLRRPADRHLRQWYVLADLYERAGDVPRARDFFEMVVAHDPEVADAGARLAALGPLRQALPDRAGQRATTTLGELAGSSATRRRSR